MYKVTKRDCPMFGIGPYVCEFICDTASDISTLPTSISEGTGGRTVYDNQKCASGSIANVAENGTESKQYILNNQDIWCPYSVASGSSDSVLEEAKAYTDSEIADLINGAPTTRDTLKEISDAMAENQTVVEALDAAIGTKANKTDIPTELPANGGNADTLDGKHANEISSNPNLLINPDFKIKQRAKNGWAVDHNDDGTVNTSTQVYVMDRWRIMDGTITIADGKVYLSGTIIQVLENSIGSNFTVSVSAESGTATASYDDSTKTFTIVGNSAVLNWAKLEYGSVATPFIPPDPILELIKCHRFYYRARSTTSPFLTGYCMNPGSADVSIPLFMRTNPTVDYNGLVVMCKDRTKSNDTGSRGYDITSARGFRCNFGIDLDFEVDTSSALMSAGCAVTLQATTPGEYGGYFALDAEIY